MFLTICQNGNLVKENYLKSDCQIMSEDEDLSGFLEGFGLTKDEQLAVIDELNAYRSIPGTNLGKYMNRVISTLAFEERPAFIKGLFLGVAIRKAADALSDPDLTEEERRIDKEIEQLVLSRKSQSLAPNG